MFSSPPAPPFLQVGTVLNVQPSLERVDVMVEVNDCSTVIPRNSIVEANQSGLIAEPLVDITPQLPLPTITAGPTDPNCEAEGSILCQNGHLQGRQVRSTALAQQCGISNVELMCQLMLDIGAIYCNFK